MLMPNVVLVERMVCIVRELYFQSSTLTTID